MDPLYSDGGDDIRDVSGGHHRDRAISDYDHIQDVLRTLALITMIVMALRASEKTYSGAADKAMHERRTPTHSPDRMAVGQQFPVDQPATFA